MPITRYVKLGQLTVAEWKSDTSDAKGIKLLPKDMPADVKAINDKCVEASRILKALNDERAKIVSKHAGKPVSATWRYDALNLGKPEAAKASASRTIETVDEATLAQYTG